MPFSDLFPTWIGGTWSGPTSGPFASSGGSDTSWSDLTNQMSNYTYDPNDPGKWQRLQDQAAAYKGPGSSNAAGGDALSGALKNLSGDASKLGSSNQSATKAPDTSLKLTPEIGQPRSAANLSNLLQLLNQKTNMYLGNINPQTAQPQQGQQTQRGLLGL